MESGPPPTAEPDHAVVSSLRLSSIELALISELSLEQAKAHEEVAEDANQPPEARRTASALATAWRERARMLQLQAERETAQPFGPGELGLPGLDYIGPERRRQSRRTQARRTDGAGGSDAFDLGERRLAGDRRAAPERRFANDRRRGDRRRRQLAPR